MSSFREIVAHRIKIMQALLDDTEIQYRFSDKKPWHDDTKEYFPDFRVCEYRIKPKPGRYRVGLFKDNDFYYTMSFERQDESESRILEQKPDFVKWLTDWIEYEVD